MWYVAAHMVRQAHHERAREAVVVTRRGGSRTPLRGRQWRQCMRGARATDGGMAWRCTAPLIWFDKLTTSGQGRPSSSPVGAVREPPLRGRQWRQCVPARAGDRRGDGMEVWGVAHMVRQAHHERAREAVVVTRRGGFANRPYGVGNGGGVCEARGRPTGGWHGGGGRRSYGSTSSPRAGKGGRRRHP